MVVANIGAILAIAVPYYVSYKRATCDRSANDDLTKVRVCIERIANELVDLDCSSLEADVSLVNLSWLVGPFYGWSGTTTKCPVRLRLNNSNTEIQTCAWAGSRPSKDIT